MSLSFAEILANPESQKALAQIYSESEIQELIKEQMTPAAIKKVISDRLTNASEEVVLAVLVCVSCLLLTPHLDGEIVEAISEAMESIKAVDPEVASLAQTASLLEDPELKLLVKAISRQDVFVTRTRKTSEADATESEAEAEVEYPLDKVAI